MASFQKLENTILFVLLSSLTFTILFSFSGNLVQPIHGANFGAAGDWGCTSNTDATLANMNGKTPERVFGLGDYSYASTGSCFFTKIDGSGLTGKTKIAIGNHEDDDSEGFSGYMSHFSQSQTYFSYNHDDVHILVIDTDRNSYASGSAQRNFVQSDLQAASTNPNIKWIIVYLHKPMYTSANECSSSSCSNTGSENTNLRNGFHPMFDQYGVDLVLQGHVHNYQRTFTLKYDAGSPSSPTITSSNANTYTEGNGAVFAVVGTGGVNFHALSGKASFTSVQQDDFFGQMDITTSGDGNTLEGKFYRNGNNAILDSFSITKAGNSPPVANPQTVTVNKDTQIPITLTATDPNNDPLTYSIVTQPSHGTLSPSTPGGPARTYTPQAGYVGPDSFTFKANDGTVDSNIATINITVAEQPQGGYNYAPSLVLTGSNYNDTPNAANLQLNQFSVAAWFKTSSNFGSDAYIVNKGGVGSESSGQNLNYGIWMNSAEQIRAGFETSSGADQFVTSTTTYNNGQWHYAVVTNDGSTLRLYVDNVQVATKSTGGASPESSGTKPVRIGANSRVTPPGNFFTGEVDEVRVWNDDLTAQQAGSAFTGTDFTDAKKVLHLPFGGNSPPVANNQAVNVIKDTQTPITLTATDPNNDPLTYSIVAQPLHGTVAPPGPGTASRTYTPTAGYLGPDSFTFKANDGTVDSNIATINITVAEQPQGGYNYAPSLVLTGSNYNDTPNAANLQLNQFSVAAWFKTSSNFGSDAYIVNKGGVGSESSGQNLNYGIWMNSAEQIRAGFETSSGADQFVTSTTTYNNGQWHYAVVTNDGSTLRLYVDNVQVATKSTGGASPESSGTKPVRIGANSRVTPPGNFFTGEVDEVRVWNDDLTAQQAGSAFTGTDFTDAKKVLHLPFGGNSPPVANNQAVNVIKDTQTPITLTATDPNNDPLTYSIVAQPLHGTVAPPGPGTASRTYTPTAGYLGPDSFTFKANDGTVDSNTATVSITVQDTASCITNLPISGVTASGNDGNLPSNAIDNNLNTRWSSLGVGQFIRADLGSTQNICSVDIAWYKGNERAYNFVIATSTDGTTFTNKLTSTSSGTTLNSEKYTIPATDARYVRITVNGNTANSWASITELDVFGSGSASSSSLYNYGPSLTLSGPSG